MLRLVKGEASFWWLTLGLQEGISCLARKVRESKSDELSVKPAAKSFRPRKNTLTTFFLRVVSWEIAKVKANFRLGVLDNCKNL